MLPPCETAPIQSALDSRTPFRIRVLCNNDENLPWFDITGKPVLGGWTITVHDKTGVLVGSMGLAEGEERDLYYLLDRMKEEMLRALSPLS